MKASGAVNRHRKQQAEAQRLTESKAVPRRLALLSPNKQKEAQEIMDLIYYGDLTDPTFDCSDEIEEPRERSAEIKPKKKKA